MAFNNTKYPTGTVLFNRYQILGHIGQGGMGHVYKVLDQEDDNVLALKTLIPKEGKNTRSIERFKKEFSAMQSLNHPNIVRAFNFHEQGHELFGFSMEIIDGENLDNLIYSEGKILELPHKVNIIEQIADGLSYAHKNNLIHRDLKPANILIENAGQFNFSPSSFNAKIVDFGLAQQEADGEDLSQSSNQIGTAYYMSPEQHRGENLDHKTDIYSFGILCFELFTGKRPFDGSTPFKLFLAHVSEDIPDIKEINPEIPSWIATMTEICCEKNKSHRYSSMSEILNLIRAKKKKPTKSIFSIFQK